MIPADLMKLYLGALRAGVKLDALIDIEWMGNPKYQTKKVCGVVCCGRHWEYGPDGSGPFYTGPTYSTNVAHAVEAKLKADNSHVDHSSQNGIVSVALISDNVDYCVTARCLYSETNGDKAFAEALAICRAIRAAKKAKEE